MNKSLEAAADAVSCYCAIVLIALVLLSSIRENLHSRVEVDDHGHGHSGEGGPSSMKNSRSMIGRPCEEIYVVGEGETLHTISDKCGDPYIVERNPHIHDPDDVFPGLVIKITPSSNY